MMVRILNFGSLNIDEVYRVSHFVRPGETLSSMGRECFCGGKGLNQSVALARAGAAVFHAGCIGTDGRFLADTLQENGVCISALRFLPGVPTGRAVIQVDDNGQNAILLFPGANACVDEPYIRQVLARFGQGDWLLLQNEISGSRKLLTLAAERRMHIVCNPSPMHRDILSLPLENVSCFLLNEIEGAALADTEQPEEILRRLRERFPRAITVLTLGQRGAFYADATETLFQPAIPAEAIDTTGAGDTFTGFLLASLADGKTAREAMRLAATAASIAVSRKGASSSIPTLKEVLCAVGE